MPMRRTRSVVLIGALTVSVFVMAFLGLEPANATAGKRVPRTTTSTTVASEFRMTRVTDPAGTVVSDSAGRWLATFTDGASTVRLTGPSRTFRESTTTATVTTTSWVRLLRAPFAGTVDTAWLRASLTDTSDDLLAVAWQYVTGAPARLDGSGRQFAGDAHYGPLQPDGTRQEGSDFGDYLGIAWTYPDGSVDAPESDQLLSLDCSGFIRMVWGYRSGMAVTGTPDGVHLPRRAVQMLSSAPGVVTIPNAGVKATAYSRLAAGDLVFFDVSTDDGTLIDHAGMYLGVDSAGHHRFVSSRKTLDGPTMGDSGGRSVVDGAGFYAAGWRAARRL